MDVIVWLVLAAFGAALFLLFGAMVELQRGLSQIRIESGIIDARARIGIDNHDGLLRAAGLPDEIYRHERAIVLVVSDMCGTCQLIAARLAGTVPDSLWMILQPRSVESGKSWLAAYALGESLRAILDPAGEITSALGVQVSPAVLRVRSGRIVAAHTVPSPRRLDEDLRWLRDGGADEPEYGPAHESLGAVTRQLESMKEGAK